MKNKMMVFGRTGLMSLCTIALAAVIGLSLAGCDDGSTDGGSSALVGKWYTSQQAANTGEESALVIKFNANGTFIGLGTNGTWTVSGTSVTLTPESGGSPMVCTYSIAGTKLTITPQGGGSPIIAYKPAN
ncbi:MAG: lipocalin family protein [Spirochaetaceae bacterium]|jgi:hypothetical protein|nr:lipocalin family protein [Spirochaetaceae bacterium]